MPDKIFVSSSFSTVQRLKELADNLRYVGGKPNGERVDMDISFATPFAITPLASAINSKSLLYEDSINSYLRTVHFPEGISDVTDGNSTYFPIIRLVMEGVSREEINRKLDSLHSKFLDLLRRNVIADPQFLQLVTQNTFGFLLGELFDNILEHSKAKNAYIFAQYWPRTNSCEICIVDDGQGLFSSLREAGRDVENDLDAMKKILEERLSSKNEFGDIYRGTGFWNTRLVIANNQINGEFSLISGNTAYVQTSQSSQFYSLSNISWNGTIVMLKLKKPVMPFNIYDYVR